MDIDALLAGDVEGSPFMMLMDGHLEGVTGVIESGWQAGSEVRISQPLGLSCGGRPECS